VTTDEQGGSAIANATTTTGASMNSPGTPTRAGYAFAGWFTASSGGTAIGFPYAHGQTADFTLYAQWTLLTCADGGTCAVGDTGPGGGIVFYVHASGTFACGATLASTCKYLEAAPTSGTNAWTDNTYAWSGNTDTQIGATAQGTAVGTGYSNTEAMVAQSNTVSRAGTISRAYRGPNNLSDWHLPSKDELNELCKYARQQTTGNTSVWCDDSGSLRSGFAGDIYWSSSETDATVAWYQAFIFGARGDTSKSDNLRVRPVRAFGATTCATGGTCAVGDTGPGGGIVFYVAGSNFTSTGSDCNTTCRYLEAAPTNWNGAGDDPVRVWSGNTNTLVGGTGTGLGTGYQNTSAAVAQVSGGNEVNRAITLAWSYSNAGKSDWHLPSKDELNQLYINKATVGGFAIDYYWSSSESFASNAWDQGFGSGDQTSFSKTGVSRVRPVRAF